MKCFTTMVLVFIVSALSAESGWPFQQACAGEPAAGGAMTVAELYCEYAADPLGVDTAQPRFSWVLRSDQRGQLQSAYCILVASSKEKLEADVGDKWDSGKVDSDRSVNVTYRGNALTSAEKCYWKVRVWDAPGRPSAWSEPATFEMGLLTQSDWEGRWIGVAPRSPSYINGKLAEAVHLDGKGETIEIPHSRRLKPAAQITISAWIKPTECTDGWREIYRKEDGNARHLLAIGKTSGLYGLWCGLGIGGSYVEHGARLAKSHLSDGQWHLVTATYDGTAIKFFADGRQIGDARVSGRLDTVGSSPAYIGSAAGSTEFFPGGIDDVRIYGRALSAGELKSLADGQSVAPGLVGHWKLDGNLQDTAGGRDGRVAGATARGVPAPLLRKQFVLDKKVRRARVYMSGLGWSELYLNGKKVGNRVLDPATTDYRRRILYVTHDVTDQLRSGANAVGGLLGNGWFSEPGVHKYGDSPRLLLQMNIDFADGTSTSIKTDETWGICSGPIVRNDIWGGETYDARLEKASWSAADYDDTEWAAASVKESPGGVLESQLMPAIRVNQTLRPVKLTNPRPEVYVYDMGQLFGGWIRLRVKGARGTKVTIKYSARIFEDSGLLDKTRHRRGNETDYYVLKGAGEEVYEPRFTYHPVRYVQIEGYPGVPTIDDVEGRVVHTAVDLSGRFQCSNAILNQVHQNVRWTLTNGLFGIPLDCLHREHWAWTDPATITGSLYPRKHMPLFWTKWLKDIADAQQEDGQVPTVCPIYPGGPRFDPAWGGNYPILVWFLHQYFDDERILREHYDGMKKCVDFFGSIAENHIITHGRYGDHMLPGDAPGNEEFISSQTPPPLVWTGYYYRGALVVSQAARLLGKVNDAQRYARLADEIKLALNDKWFDPQLNQYATGAQTANLFPLALGIVPVEREAGVLENVIRDITDRHGGHLHTGNTGTTCMIDTLTQRGHGDLMYRVATVPTYPGWGYMVAQGATTIWENWGGVYRGKGNRLAGSGAESMIMWATIDEFLYNDLAGIRGPEYYGPGYMEPGFRRIEIRPHVLGDLTFANASIRTVRGIVSSRWRRHVSGLMLDVALPPGSRAKVSVPTLGLKNVAVTESGKPVWKGGSYIDGVAGITGASRSADCVTFDVGSGSYCFHLSGP